MGMADSVMMHVAENDPLDVLRQNCFKVQYTVSWIPSSAAVSKEHKTGMLQSLAETLGDGSTRIDEDSMGLFKKLFANKNPTLVNLRQCRAALDAVRKSYTIPMLDTGSSPEQVRAGIAVRAAAGIRLIRKDQIEEFDRRFQEAVNNLYAAARAVDDAMPEILADEQRRLKTTFDRKDYPTSVVNTIHVSGPYYTEMSIALKLPSAIAERQIKAVREQFEASMMLASDQLVSEMTEAMLQLANQLGHRRKTGRDLGMVYHNYADCMIVMEKILPNQRYQVTIKKEILGDVAKGEKDREEIHRLEFDNREDFEESLKPQIIPNAAGRIQERTVETVFKWVDDFGRLKDLLGDHGMELDAKLATLRKSITELSRAVDPTERLRRSTDQRERLASALRGVVDQMQQSNEVKVFTRSNRMVNVA